MTLVDKFAEIIVDVPAMQTNQPFTYLIPEEFRQVVSVGMRVEVPFGNGNRHIQGFITNIVTEAPRVTDSLKAITNILDLKPVLNEELLLLADEMAQKTYSFKITCLQTMLPSVMRSSYKKWIVKTAEIEPDIDEQLFKGLAEIEWDKALESIPLSKLLSLRAEEKIDLRYEVLTKNKIKTKKVIKKKMTTTELQEVAKSIRANAKQQQKLCAFLMEFAEDSEVSLLELMQEHDLSRTAITSAEKAGWLSIEEREVYRDPYAFQSFKQDTPLDLNDEQDKALAEVIKAQDENAPTTFLLEGVTGSGKTEVYLQAISHVLNKGKTAIMLVPEISLTPQTVTRFKKRFGADVAVLHSGLSEGERYDEWRKIERNEARVVVGARSAVFAPLENIGLLIVDEEHESSYKQDETPRYHARDVAIWRSQYHDCPVILGSATPSLESRARAQKNVYQLLPLTKRAVADAVLPKVEIVDMRKAIAQTKNSFSTELIQKLTERLALGEQAVLMLNRRGFSSFIMCRDCGFVLPCPNCDISLTLHMDTKTMKCHYCGHEERIPYQCPSCHSDKIRYYGTGTQKVETELQELLPDARIIRMDVDTTRKKGSHQALLRRFENHEADILLGTQMIAKGLDFPNVTLVGVLNADTALNLPDFRSSERTFQLLTQVSGRSGRGDKPGEVVIQTFNPDHYAIQLVQDQDYETFYRKEMSLRHLSGYPPYYFTVQVVASHEDEYLAAKKIYQIAEKLKTSLSEQAVVLGPTPKSIARVNKRYFYQIVIKYRHEPNLEQALNDLMVASQVEIQKGMRIVIDVEPQNFI